jgi:hypothetical protein
LFFFSTTDGNTYISNGSSFIGNIKVYISNSKNTALVEVQKGTGGYKTVEGTVYELAPSSQHSFFDQYPYLKYLKIMEVQYNIDEIMKDEDLTSGDKIFLDIYLTSLKGLGAITPQRIRRFAIDVN